MVQNVVLSESEPEDEGKCPFQVHSLSLVNTAFPFLTLDAVKIHQAKLQARKNRLSSNVSSLSTANNRRPINKTLDLTGLLSKYTFFTYATFLIKFVM